ncbi:MAG: 3'-5' exonuclease [Elusimicrobiota bacterium]
MAIIIPQNPGTNATKGEKKVFDYFKKLDEECLVYFNISVRGYYPDFILICKDLGVFVIEVKDWTLEQIKIIRKDEVVLNINGEEKTVKNPVVQARDYVIKVINEIDKFSYLKNKKNLKLKWGYGVFFTNIKRAEIEKLSIISEIFNEVFGYDFIFTSDDISDGSLFNKIKERMKKHYGELSLSNKEIDFIRGVIYPELLIENIYDDYELIKIIDEKQEQIARNIDFGHYLIRGVAGSGKTVILIARARFLSLAYPNFKILFVCYNKALANYIKEKFKEYRNIEVMTYHGWCFKELIRHRIISDKDNFTHQDFDITLPQKLFDNYLNGEINKKYDAIIIDEGQDFEALWYKTLLLALNRETNSLLIAVDSSQSIYNRKVRWKSIGIDIVGRTKVFKKNYRNTKQILDSAYKLIKDIDEKKENFYEEEMEYVVPEQALREGPNPKFNGFNSFDEEIKYLVNLIKEKNNKEEILIISYSRANVEEIGLHLKKSKIKYRIVSEKTPESNVILSTIHSSKGLEADNVFIIDAHEIEKHYKSEAKRLLYIAMTRSKKDLYVFYRGDSQLIKDII